jgi:hypothetical protein
MLRPIFRARAQGAQVMPVVDPVVVTILPDDGQRVGSYGNHIAEARRRCISQLEIEHVRIRFRLHILVPAAAGGAGTSGAQQFKRIDTRMLVIPCDREFSGLFVGSNAGWFFVHINSGKESTTPVVEIPK